MIGKSTETGCEEARSEKKVADIREKFGAASL